MSQKITNEAGEEIEVFTADEVQQREDAAKETVKGEYEPKVNELTEKLTDAEKRAQERAGEFAHFRKLNDEQVAKLTVAERTIYENQLALEQERTKNAELTAAAQQAQVASVIKAKAAGNSDLEKKMAELWPVIAVDAVTPEQIEAKAMMVLGAISTTTPDLVATMGNFSGGSYTPPTTAQQDGQSFADTDAGKKAAAELGLTIEPPKA